MAVTEPLGPRTVKLTMVVNGQTVDRRVEPRTTLADLLRHTLGLTGTHVGCEHGICGACTVLVDGEPVRSCLLFAPQLDGCEITTVEGLAPEMPSTLEAFSEHHALQCGFCTPGFLVLAAVSQREHADTQRVRELVSSNLCRCTGYQGIVQAISATVDREGRA